RQRVVDSQKVFVGQNGENQRGALGTKNFAPRIGESARSGRVMRTINNCAVVPSLKTCRPFDTCKSLRNRRVIDIDLGRAKRSNRKSGILLLIRPEKRNSRLVVMFGHERSEEHTSELQSRVD